MVRTRTFFTAMTALLMIGLAAPLSYARSDRVKGAQPFDSSSETVDLFQAVEQGKLSVKVIPRDSKECRVFITNESSSALNVTLPAALAAVPVLAQPGLNGPGQLANSATTPQRLGVGNPFGLQNPLQMGPNMQGGPMMNQGNQPFFAPFNVAPEKVAQLRLPAVCLDLGHPDPRPAMRYRLAPLSEISDSQELALLCRRLGCDPTLQRVAQAIAWHLSNGKTWQEMQKMIVRRLGRPNEFFFARSEIEAAQAMAEAFEKEVGPKNNPSSVASLR